MVNKKIVSINIFFSLIQILVTGLVYYFLYKFLLNKVGADLMGVWAIVLSVSSAANIANLGIGASVVRYTATYKAKNDAVSIGKLVFTSFLFLGGVLLVIVLIVFLISSFWLHAVIAKKYYAIAMALVPLSLSCLFLNAISGIFLSCLDGLQKNYARSILYITSSVILLSCVYTFVPQMGLMGVAYAQLGQAAFLLVSSMASLKLFFLKEIGFSSFKWDKAIFKKIFSFGIQEQVISLCQLCFDPLTKSILGSFGNLSMVTYYEMANRLVTITRGFLVSANQVFIPIFSNAHEISVESKHNVYKKIFSVNFLLSLLWISAIVASVVPVSKMWIGNMNTEFVIISIFLVFAYWWNIIMNPSYFANMGSATLRDNVVGNIIIAACNLSLCIALGYFFKGYGVIAGWSISLTLGSIYTIVKYHKRNAIKISELLTGKDAVLLILALVYAVSCLIFFYLDNSLNVFVMLGIDVLLFLVLCGAIYIINPQIKVLFSAIQKKKIAVL